MIDLITVLWSFAVYTLSASLVILILKFHKEYQDNITNEGSTYKEDEFVKKVMVLCPVLNTLIVFSYLYYLLKWILKIK